MKKYIQIEKFQHSFFFSNLHAYISSGPEKEGVRVDGLGWGEVKVQQLVSSYTFSALRKEGDI